MSDKEYPLQSFYLYLKLGLWQSGQVAAWGRIDTVCSNADGMTDKGFFLRRPLESYLRSPLIKKRLDTGLFLLDTYCLTKNSATGESVHVAVIAVCKATMDSLEAVHCLRITGRADSRQFQAAVESGTDGAAAGSYRRKRQTGRHGNRIDTSPIHSYTRKY